MASDRGRLRWRSQAAWRCSLSATSSRRSPAGCRPARKPIILILGGLACLIALIALGGGFMIGTAILFATTSAAFGRRAFLTDLLIGAVIAVVVYLLFAKLLALSLPAGPLERLL